jgi:hypothetical protein
MSALSRVLAGFVMAITLGGAVAADASGATIPRSVIGSGATTATGSGRVLQGTVGQPVVGGSASPARAAAHGFWTFGPPTTTSVDPSGGGLASPSVIEFGTPTPNPSHGALAFVVGLPRAATVSLLVADVRGRVVSPPTSQALDAGRHRVGFDPAGDARIASGIYFARLIVDGRVEGVQRFVRIR